MYYFWEVSCINFKYNFPKLKIMGLEKNLFVGVVERIVEGSTTSKYCVIDLRDGVGQSCDDIGLLARGTFSWYPYEIKQDGVTYDIPANIGELRPNDVYHKLGFVDKFRFKRTLA